MDRAALRALLAAELPLNDTLLSIGWSISWPNPSNGASLGADLFDEHGVHVGRYTANDAWSLLRSLAAGRVLCGCGGECMECDDVGTRPAPVSRPSASSLAAYAEGLRAPYPWQAETSRQIAAVVEDLRAACDPATYRREVA